MNAPASPWFRRRSSQTLQTGGIALIVLFVAALMAAMALHQPFISNLTIPVASFGGWMLGASRRNALRLTSKGVRAEGNWKGFTVPYEHLTGVTAEEGRSLGRPVVRLVLHDQGRARPVASVTRPATSEGRAEMAELVGWLRDATRVQA